METLSQRTKVPQGKHTCWSCGMSIAVCASNVYQVWAPSHRTGWKPCLLFLEVSPHNHFATLPQPCALMLCLLGSDTLNCAHLDDLDMSVLQLYCSLTISLPKCLLPDGSLPYPIVASCGNISKVLWHQLPSCCAAHGFISVWHSVLFLENRALSQFNRILFVMAPNLSLVFLYSIPHP